MSAGIGALIAHVAFWVLLVYGWFWDELGLRGIGVFLLLWVAGFLGAGWNPVWRRDVLLVRRAPRHRARIHHLQGGPAGHLKHGSHDLTMALTRDRTRSHRSHDLTDLTDQDLLDHRSR